MEFQPRRTTLLQHLLTVGFLALAFLPAGCASNRNGAARALRQMGEAIQVGPVVYIVLDAEWQQQLSGSGAPRLPKNNFLVLRLNVTNAGNRELTIPLLQLEDEKGAEHYEVSELAGLEEWLGLLRPIKPSDTVQGRIVFDVSPANYRLRVTDGGDPGEEVTALVEIPLKLRPGMPAVGEGVLKQ